MRFIVLFCSILMTQCDENKDSIFCTEQFVYGLNVTVKDANTSLVLTESITVTAIEGMYEEELTNIEGMDSFLGAGERPGNYIIEVTADGYQDFTSGIIRVDADECHVIPKVLEVILQPN